MVEIEKFSCILQTETLRIAMDDDVGGATSNNELYTSYVPGIYGRNKVKIIPTTG